VARNKKFQELKKFLPQMNSLIPVNGRLLVVRLEASLPSQLAPQLQEGAGMLMQTGRTIKPVPIGLRVGYKHPLITKEAVGKVSFTISY